jgi:hypothetical protein
MEQFGVGLVRGAAAHLRKEFVKRDHLAPLVVRLLLAAKDADQSRRHLDQSRWHLARSLAHPRADAARPAKGGFILALALLRRGRFRPKEVVVLLAQLHLGDGAVAVRVERLHQVADLGDGGLVTPRGALLKDEQPQKDEDACHVITQKRLTGGEERGAGAMRREGRSAPMAAMRSSSVAGRRAASLYERERLARSSCMPSHTCHVAPRGE